MPAVSLSACHARRRHAGDGAAPTCLARRARRAIIGYRRLRGSLSAWECGLDQSRDSLDWAGIHADQALMAAIAEGDDAVFARLVRSLTPALLRFARATLAASPAEAEEVVQEALIRLWQQAADWQPDGRISTWAHRVTYRLCIDRLRRLRPADRSRRGRGRPCRSGAAARRPADAARGCAGRAGGGRRAARAPARRDRALPLPGPRPGRSRRRHGARRRGLRILAGARPPSSARPLQQTEVVSHDRRRTDRT